MSKSVFEFSDYKEYLRTHLSPSGNNRGSRTKLAQELGCQIAFVSKVLNGTAHFSAEHAVQISRFLAHDDEEARYFILLVNLGRAGSKLLEDHYKAQVTKIQKHRRDIRNRVNAKQSISQSDQMTYYSSWYYGALHVLASIPEFRTKQALAKRLNLSVNQVTEYLEFLVSVGILDEKDGQYSVGAVRMHLAKNSPLLAKHHTHWRVQAINSIDRKHEHDLHYSLAFSISQNDVEKVRNMLLSAIDKTEEIMKPSKEEKAYCLLMDYFEI